jgi:hypothetical protein
MFQIFKFLFLCCSVERQKIGRKPFFINFSKKTFFDPGVILAKLTFFRKKAKKLHIFMICRSKKTVSIYSESAKKVLQLQYKKIFLEKKYVT